MITMLSIQISISKSLRFSGSDAEGIPAISRWLSEATPPDHHASIVRIPKGCQQRRTSVQIPIFVFHTRLFQEFHQLLAKRFDAMMLGLVRDVFLHLRSRRRTHREGSVAFLPRKLTALDFLMHPNGRALLQLAHEVPKAMRRLQSNQQMDVISHATHALSESSETTDCSTEILVQTPTPRFVNQRHSIFCGKDDVVMQSKKRRGHGGAGWLASLRDAIIFRIVTGGVALLNHRLIAWNPSGSMSFPAPQP